MVDGELEGVWIDQPDLAAASRERADLAARRGIIEMRAKMMAAIRRFFDENGFLEVFTPVRIPVPALEDYIEAVPSGDSWLRTSPEFHIKRMIAAGYEKVFQTGPCFRREESGRRHLLEFTMLEWYRTGGDWLDVLDDSERLMRCVAQECVGGTVCRFRDHDLDLSLPWERLTVDEAFQRYAGVDLDKCIANGEFEAVLVTDVEPHLGVNGRPTALTEYPLACSGLSKQIPGRLSRVERWEVYVSGLELGNACTELAEPEEQTRRFVECTRLRLREGRDIYRLDQPFLDAIRLGFPHVAGVAIGLDRLLMLLSNCDDIAQTVAFK